MNVAIEQPQYLHDVTTAGSLHCNLRREENITTSLYNFIETPQKKNTSCWISPIYVHVAGILILLFATGLQTSQDARFYALSSRFDDFNNKGKTLVIQFTVKHEQNIDCGGGYIKLFPSGLNQEEMHGDSVYNIMFGECGQLPDSLSHPFDSTSYVRTQSPWWSCCV